MLAEAALLDGDRETAEGQAATAFRSFARQARPHWASLARYTALRASLLDGTASPARLRAARRSAAALAEAGWAGPALDRQISQRAAGARARPDRVARETLSRIRVSGREPVELVCVQSTRARCSLSPTAAAEEAYAALRAGMRFLADIARPWRDRAPRAGQRPGRGARPARLAPRGRGCRPAAHPGVVRGVSRDAIRLRPVRPPDDETVAAELAELRRVASLAQAEGLASVDARHLRRRQAELEESIRRRTRRARAAPRSRCMRAAPPRSGPCWRPGPDRLLRPRGVLHAVTVVEGRALLHRLCPAARGADGARRAPFSAAARTADEPGRVREAIHAAAMHAAVRLDEALLRPLAPAVDGRPLVVVPTGSLHATPWAIAPSLAGRAVTVAPSAASWAAAEERRLDTAAGSSGPP